ncbi:hypothetical protein ACTD5D_31420 [Nocardia takedensis]|uniref:hypothetical protein n=1 Tax=Nocardia takedensis TaxID=259390 RepID=UPI003F767AA9
MSDRSTEDEIRAELRQFAHSLPHLLRLHAQAGTWLERRRVRKQINLTLREQRRAEDAARVEQVQWTQRTIDRYRSHALVVAERATDPNVDHTRRYHDAQALTRHADTLRATIVDNDRLTTVERGIALDGVDAATTFPHFETGRLFDRAHKVRGLDALRYRARVARETGAVRDRGVNADWPRRLAEARDRQAEKEWLDQRERDAADPNRYQVSVVWTRPDGTRDREEQSFGTEYMSASWQYGAVDSILTFDDTTVSVETWDSRDDRAPIYRHEGTPAAVARAAQARAESLRRQALEHPVRREDAPVRETPPPPEHILRDQVRADLSRLVGTRTTRPDGGPGAEPSTGSGIDHKEGVQVEPDRLAAVEAELSQLRADRDRLGSRVAMLQRGLDAVTADRDRTRRRLDAAEAEVTAVKARNQRLVAEINEVRDRATGPVLSPGVAEHVRHIEAERDQARRDRDRYQRERDQARGAARPAGSQQRRAQEQAAQNGERSGRGSGQSDRDRAVAEWNELVGRNMAEALAEIPDRPEIAKRDLGKVDWTRFTTGDDNADELARWWAEGGAAQYWAEHDNRNRPAPGATQAWQPDPTGQPERNGQRRNGIERSR